MYGVVSTDQGKPRKLSSHHHHHHHHHHHQHHHHPHHRPLSQSQSSSEPPQQQLSRESRNRNRNPKSITSRFWEFIKHTWTGVKFALESELDELDNQPRYKPRESLQALCRLTRFSESEIKRMYRGFKAECPSGIVQEDTFRDIYSQFFPQGANTGHYAHYVFNALDQSRNGLISFEDFVLGLSMLLRGSVDEKLRWTFSLYDINGDGYISKEELKDIVTAIFELMGTSVEPIIEDKTVQERVDNIFQKMDQNHDGVVSLDEFLECCSKDENILNSISVFDSSVI